MSASLRRALRSALPTLLSGGLFLVIALLYRSGWTQSVDRAVEAFVNSIDDPTLDAIADLDDALARAIPTFALAIVLAVAYAWRKRGWAWCVPFFISLTAIIEFFAKLGFDRGMHLGEIIAAARELLGARFSTGASFPSGHVARSVFLATVVARLGPRWLAVPLAGFAALTFAARLYIEAHRLSDVVAGAALGLFAASAGLWLRSMLADRATPRRSAIVAAEAHRAA